MDGKVDLKKMNNVFSHNTTEMKPTKCTTIYKALLHLYSCYFIIMDVYAFSMKKREESLSSSKMPLLLSRNIRIRI